MERVTIVMSIYRPNRQYLEEQLKSLNEQTYDNLELLVWNDCPDEEIDRGLFERTVTRIPVRFYDEKRNLGYIGAFGRLSELAEGEYISYCDQDDIWLPQKIAECMAGIRRDGSVAAVCDRMLMTAEGEVYCPSFREANRLASCNWKTGDDITRRAAFFSYCTGMTLIARRDLVQRYLPFIPEIHHDQQLIFFLSAEGKLSCIEKPLVKHRRHGNNASGTLLGIDSKKDYYNLRCRPAEALLNRFETLFPGWKDLPEMRACCRARIRGSIPGIWKYRDMIPDLYRYEMALAMCPDWLFRKLKGIVISRHPG